MSTRAVDDLTKACGLTGISKSLLSRLCAKIDERVQAFLNRRLETAAPFGMVRRETGRIFVMTCADIDPDRHPLETSRRGVFVIGDVRAGSVKRVAAAVGEGAQVVATLHTFLAERTRELAAADA